jgi:hypothetical protein
MHVTELQRWISADTEFAHGASDTSPATRTPRNGR